MHESTELRARGTGDEIPVLTASGRNTIVIAFPFKDHCGLAGGEMRLRTYCRVMAAAAAFSVAAAAQAPAPGEKPAAQSETDRDADPEPAPPDREWERPEAATCLRGRVVVEGGGVLQHAATVTCSCSPGDVTATESTKDRFSVCLPQPARPAGHYLPSPMYTCECRASVPGYRSSVAAANARMGVDQPDVGMLLLRRVGENEAATVSHTSLLAPDKARKAYDKGVAAGRKRKWEEARESLSEAVRLYAKYAEAWYELGVAHAALRDTAEARRAFDQAIASDPRFLSPYLPLATIFLEEQKWSEVLATTERLIRLRPSEYPNAYLYHGIAELNLGDLGAAEKSVREAIRIDVKRRRPRAEHVLGLILAQKGDYAAAAEHFRKYLETAPDAPDAGIVRNQLSTAERMAASQER